jgi:DNA primase
MTRTIVDILSEMFGFPRCYTHGQSDVPFNCPKCDGGGNKYNLEVNASKGVFHCWACGYKGKLIRLFNDYASDRQWSVLRSLPVYHKSTNEIQVSRSVAQTPKIQIKPRETLGSYRALSIPWEDSIHYYAAINYLKSRGITLDMIKKWDIAYAEKGPNKFRVIIPSRAETGELEYYVARGFYDYVKPKYKNPTIPKQDIIFGEHFIDWRRSVVLVEGVFDSIIALNTVPIMGTAIKSHTKLLQKIRANHTPITICLDTEAWDKAKEAYKVLDDIGVDVKIVRVPKIYGDLSSAFEIAGKPAVLEILDSAHKMTFEESLW